MIDTSALSLDESHTWTPAELAAYVADIIRTKPELHDQRYYYHGELESWYTAGRREIPTSLALDILTGAKAPSCGSTACVAGWVSVLHAPVGSYIWGSAVTVPAGGTHDAHYYGANALDLNGEDADWLFSGDRTRAEVLAALDSIAEAGSFDGYAIQADPAINHEYEYDYELPEDD